MVGALSEQATSRYAVVDGVKIHYNEAPARHIRGTASQRDVAELRDEGIEVVALPVPPHLTNKQH